MDMDLCGIPEGLFVYPDKIPQRLYCSICLDVALQPVFTQCEHLFCDNCIETLRKHSGTTCECPNCRQEIVKLNPAKVARQLLAEAEVFCSEIPELRCGWTGKYAMWPTHKEKYCSRASKADRSEAKSQKTMGIEHMTKDELGTMSVSRLKSILKSHNAPHKQFIEKSEYINGVYALFHTAPSSASSSSAQPNHSHMNGSSSQHHNTTMPKTRDELSKLRIRDLTSYLKSRNIDFKGSGAVVNKSDLITLILQCQQNEADVISGEASYDPRFEKTGVFTPPQPTQPKSKSKPSHASDDTAARPSVSIPDHLSSNAARQSFSGHPAAAAPPNTAYSFVYENNREDLNYDPDISMRDAEADEKTIPPTQEQSSSQHIRNPQPYSHINPSPQAARQQPQQPTYHQQRQQQQSQPYRNQHQSPQQQQQQPTQTRKSNNNSNNYHPNNHNNPYMHTHTHTHTHTQPPQPPYNNHHHHHHPYGYPTVPPQPHPPQPPSSSSFMGGRRSEPYFCTPHETLDMRGIQADIAAAQNAAAAAQRAAAQAQRMAASATAAAAAQRQQQRTSGVRTFWDRLRNAL